MAEKLKPIEAKLDSVNKAVNNVGPDAPPLKDRVGKLETGQERMHSQMGLMDGKIGILDGKMGMAVDMLRELIGRQDG